MRRRSGRALFLLTGLALVAASCGDDTAETTTTTTLPVETTTTAVVVTTTPTTTTTTLPGGPPLITEGDSNETVAAFQWLLDCAGYATLTVDGNFGSATGTALQTALTTIGRTVPDNDAFGDLSRLCTEVRPLVADDDEFTVVGNASPDDPEQFLLPLIFDSSLTITITPSDGVLVAVQGPGGTPIAPGPATGTTTTTTTLPGTTTTTSTTLAPTTTTTTIPPSGLPTMTWAIGATGDYTIVVTSDFEPATFSLEIEIGDDAEGIADWLITTTGITYKENPKLEIGDNGEDIIDKIFEYLGHGVRGGTEFDTGWTAEGFRGVAIEGFRFLFYGPSPGELARVRIFAPGNDAAGNPRPASYAMTPQGIGPGMTRAQLLEVYPGLGSGETDDGDHYYRLTNAGGELCFYFGEETVTDASVIVEISTECRS